MREEVLVHKAMVALRMVPRNPDVLILVGSVHAVCATLEGKGVAEERYPYHVERDHISERNLASFVALNKMLVY